MVGLLKWDHFTLLEEVNIESSFTSGTFVQILGNAKKLSKRAHDFFLLGYSLLYGSVGR